MNFKKFLIGTIAINIILFLLQFSIILYVIFVGHANLRHSVDSLDLPAQTKMLDYEVYETELHSSRVRYIVYGTNQDLNKIIDFYAQELTGEKLPMNHVEEQDEVFTFERGLSLVGDEEITVYTNPLRDYRLTKGGGSYAEATQFINETIDANKGYKNYYVLKHFYTDAWQEDL